MSFISIISDFAKQAELVHTKQNDRVSCIDYDLNGSRKQRVYVVASGQDTDGYDMVEFSSPALDMSQYGDSLSQAKANELLRANAGFAHCCWAIQTVDGKNYIAATSSRILNTLDLEEFVTAARHVAVAADGFEAQFGQDVF